MMSPVYTLPGERVGVRVFRATNPRLRKGLSWGESTCVGGQGLGHGGVPQGAVAAPSRSRRWARPRCPTGSWPHRSRPRRPWELPLGTLRPRWRHALPCRFGLVVTAPAPVRALRQRQGRDDPALPRSPTTQGRSVCPGPCTVTLANPELREHTREDRAAAPSGAGAFCEGLPGGMDGMMGLISGARRRGDRRRYPADVASLLRVSQNRESSSCERQTPR